jgi:predicted nicotinamide N-methyase
MQWKTKRVNETFSNVSLELEVLSSLDETIDELFVELQREGREDELDLLCPYFGVVWPSARVLAAELAEKSIERYAGALRILEVGCGLALPSLVLLNQIHLSKLVVSDCHPEVKRFLDRNLELNRIPSSALEFQSWSFEDLAKLNRKWDLVVGSDILYESKHPEALAEAIDRVTQPNGRVLVTDPARPYLQKFQDEMKARGWISEPKIRTALNEAGELKEIFLFDFSKKPIAPLRF